MQIFNWYTVWWDGSHDFIICNRFAYIFRVQSELPLWWLLLWLKNDSLKNDWVSSLKSKVKVFWNKKSFGPSEHLPAEGLRSKAGKNPSFMRMWLKDRGWGYNCLKQMFTTSEQISTKSQNSMWKPEKRIWPDHKKKKKTPVVVTQKADTK